MLPPEEQAAAVEKAAAADATPEKKVGVPKIQADIVSDVDPKSGESGKKKKKKKKGSIVIKKESTMSSPNTDSKEIAETKLVVEEKELNP